MSLRLLQINLHHSKAASAAVLLRLTEVGADPDLVREPWVVEGKVAGLGTKEYKLMLDPKEGKIRTCILAKRHLIIFLLRNNSNGVNTAVAAWQTFCKVKSPSSKESLNLLLDAHFPGSQQAGYPPERGAGEGIELDTPIRPQHEMVHS